MGENPLNGSGRDDNNRYDIVWTWCESIRKSVLEKKLEREKYLKNLGYKEFRIISTTDTIPTRK